MKYTTALVTLGCVKNEIDSELILGYFNSKGFEITTNLSKADIIVVNTCGFIESAKEEAINTILDMAEYKINGKCKYLVVVGCLAKRYKKEIIDNFEEVDLVIGIDEYNRIDEIFSNLLNINNSSLCLDFQKRIVSTKFPTAYIRIADGCNNNCTYCAIPLIRGKLKSRKIEDILSEAKMLENGNIQELVIIAQDTTSYGIDIYGKPMLYELVKRLSEMNFHWIRILYMYPGKVNEDLLNEMKTNPKICKYFDLPIQHISNSMLKAMNRHTNKEETLELISKIRKTIPDAIIRTTVMLGFPGETDSDFEELKECLSLAAFDRLGAFTFSPEEDTVAYSMKDQVAENIKQKRYDEIMEYQMNILSKTMQRNIGKKVEILVLDVTEDEKYFECRSYMDAPDVDPKIYLPLKENIDKVIVGEFYMAELIDICGYDYICKLVK